MELTSTYKAFKEKFDYKQSENVNYKGMKISGINNIEITKLPPNVVCIAFENGPCLSYSCSLFSNFLDNFMNIN